MKHPFATKTSWLLVPGSWLLVLGSCFLVSCRPDTTCRLTDMNYRLQIGITDTAGKTQTQLLEMSAMHDILEYSILRTDDSLQTTLHVHYHNADTQFVSMACGCRIAYKLDSVWTEDTLVAKATITDYDVPSYDGRVQANNIEITLP